MCFVSISELLSSIDNLMYSLETVKAGQSFQLLNSDDHAHILKKNNKNAAEYRPDICHQCLMMLLDSPLSKAGKLEVYIHTEANVTIQVLAFSTLVAPPVANVSDSA